MAKTTLLSAFLILFIGVSAGLTFNVDIADVTDHTIRDLNYSEEVSTVQDIEATIENVGSIACSYRFKAVFDQGNDSFERYSAPSPLWQGAYDDVSIHYIPMNYTGMVETNLSVEYCNQEKEIDSFKFNVTENTFPGAERESRTVNVNESEALIEVDSGELLVPEESPSFWKVSSAEVVNESATIEYDAPIFSASELKYTVLEDDEVVGSVNVKLEEDPTTWEKLQDYRLEGLAALLILSVIANLGLLAEKKDLREKLPELKTDFDLPDFRKSD